MKLLTKTNLYTIFFSFCLFCLGGMLFYTTIPSVFRDELDEQLMGHRDRIIHDLQLHPPAGPFVSIGGDMELRVLSSAYTGKSSLKDTLLYDPVEKERVPFRQLTFQAVSGDKAYQVSTRKSSVETDDLMQSILLNMFFLFIALLAGLFVINFLLAKKVWQPFYVMLHRMKSFNLSGQQEIELPECNTHEFTELKAVLDNMASRIHNDYNNLKGFTENASHEMQTPLAIIKSRLELLV